MKEEVRQSLMDQWIYHAGRCDECAGFPKLCQRGKYLHQRLWPEDWERLTAAKKETGMKHHCETCKDVGWVCNDHGKPWSYEIGCRCSLGIACVCNPMANLEFTPPTAAKKEEAK